MRKVFHIFPFWIVFFAVLLFFVIAFLPQKDGDFTAGFLPAYYTYAKGFILNFRIAFAVLFIVVLILFNRSRKSSFYKRHLIHPLQILAAVIVGFFLSYALLLVIAFIQLNVLAIVVNANPAILGIKTEPGAIAAAIKSLSGAPLVFASEKGHVLPILAAASTGTDNFYGSMILPAIPPSFILSTDALETDVMLLDSTLIVTRITHSDMHIISPVLGHSLIKHYFPGIKINSDPVVVAMEKRDYQVYREADVKKKILTIDSELIRIKDAVSSVSAAILEDKEKIVLNQDFIEQVPSLRDAEYKACIASKQYSQADCRKQRAQWFESVSQGQKNVKDWEKKLEADEKVLQQYKNYAVFFLKQRDILEKGKEKITHEFGAFEPPNSIRILVTSSDSEAMQYYIPTLIHEYLHYASFQSRDRVFETTFFEEGLTEYFTRQIIRQNLQEDLGLGYPEHVKILEEIAAKIPQKELAQIYFTKDERRLSTLLDSAYGKDFFANTRILFQTLHYSSDQRETVQLATGIVRKMDAVLSSETGFAATQ